MTRQPRVHISLNVRNLSESVAFYETLLGESPSKSKTDYAKFEPAGLALNLALNAVDDTPSSSRVSHFGIQVDTPAEVRDANERLRKAGLVPIPEEGVTCCYAVQDKAWVVDPDGNAWEVFAVTQADTVAHTEGESKAPIACCPTDESRCC